MQGASEQCMQATEIDFSPGTPSLRVTTRRRLTPHGMSCSFLQAVTQPLHSMQRSESQMNFILAIFISNQWRSEQRCFATFGPTPMSLGFLDRADRGLGLLHHGHAVVAVGRGGVDRL